MGEPYLLFEVAHSRLLLAAAHSAVILPDPVDEARDLCTMFGALPAEAWIACTNGTVLGVSRVLSLHSLDPGDFTALPAPLVKGATLFDAVTRLPLEGAHALRLDVQALLGA